MVKSEDSLIPITSAAVLLLDGDSFRILRSSRRFSFSFLKSLFSSLYEFFSESSVLSRSFSLVISDFLKKRIYILFCCIYARGHFAENAVRKLFVVM